MPRNTGLTRSEIRLKLSGKFGKKESAHVAVEENIPQSGCRLLRTGSHCKVVQLSSSVHSSSSGVHHPCGLNHYSTNEGGILVLGGILQIFDTQARFFSNLFFRIELVTSSLKINADSFTSDFVETKVVKLLVLPYTL
ncbi:hypothetical protein CEXT_561971 [Caerostris extrusa]|uniref:Uncharacterized protein n=1 Tax=Caerostris extrusa TaxID=172846 RepID=A0AAV4NMQ3_CAEEX|nr:hypothetical protein CEXT_561971 [Caerostris extrusa]